MIRVLFCCNRGNETQWGMEDLVMLIEFEEIFGIQRRFEEIVHGFDSISGNL
jgi:hypothetical protein